MSRSERPGAAAQRCSRPVAYSPACTSRLLLGATLVNFLLRFEAAHASKVAVGTLPSGDVGLAVPPSAHHQRHRRPHEKREVAGGASAEGGRHSSSGSSLLGVSAAEASTSHQQDEAAEQLEADVTALQASVRQLAARLQEAADVALLAASYGSDTEPPGSGLAGAAAAASAAQALASALPNLPEWALAGGVAAAASRDPDSAAPPGEGSDEVSNQNAIATAAGHAQRQVSEATAAGIAQAREGAGEAAGQVASAAEPGIQKATAAGKQAISSTRSAAQEGAAATQSAARQVASATQPAVSQAQSAASQAASATQSAAGQVASATQPVASEVGSTAQSAASRAASAAQSAASQAASATQSAAAPAANATAQHATQLQGAMQDLGNEVLVRAPPSAWSWLAIIVALLLCAAFWEGFTSLVLRRKLRDEPEFREAAFQMESEMVKLGTVTMAGLLLHEFTKAFDGLDVHLEALNTTVAAARSSALAAASSSGGSAGLLQLAARGARRHAEPDVAEDGTVYSVFAICIFALFILKVQCVCGASLLSSQLLRRTRRWQQVERFSAEVLLLAKKHSRTPLPEDVLQFHLLRQDFIQPFTSATNQRPDMQAAEGFNFARYLKLVTCRTMVSCQRIPPACFLALLVLLVPQVALSEPGMQDESSAVILQLYFVSLSWLCFLAWVGLESFLSSLYATLLPPASSLEYRASLLQPVASAPEVPAAEALLAPYRRLEVARCEGSCLCPEACRLLWYGSKRPTQHEQLFWRWRRGPDSLLGLMRLLSAVQKVLVATFLITLYVLWPSSHIFWSAVLFVIPLILTLARLPEVLVTFAVATSVGDMVQHDVLETVMNERSAAYAEEILAIAAIAHATCLHAACFVQDGARDPSAAVREGLGAAGADASTQCISQLCERYVSLFDAATQRLHMHAFASLASGSGGQLGREKLDDCLRILGVRCPRVALETWFLIFDATSSQSLDRQEFQALLAGHTMATTGYINQEQVVEMITELLGIGEEDSLTVRDVVDFLEALRIESAEGTLQVAKIVVMRLRQSLPNGLPGTAGSPHCAQITARELAYFLRRVGELEGGR
eukprot:TRINITY_DN121430_c0_g1_i1.p1 TRINITY_DN121430_c0_g1~~TRINITY_DN121430_c0_g1_i1.p1  ORF type:complete len:1102 (-),score=260.41 TRINITY_DN121430_c0_g1_i1:31-3270(-)